MAITVDFDPIPGFPKISISWENIEVIHQFRVAYDDSITFAKEIVGFAIGGILHTPMEFDFGDEPISNIFATNCEIQPIVGFAAEGGYKYALCTVTYRNRTFDIDSPGSGGAGTAGTIYASESLEGASEFITLTKEGLYWDEGGTETKVGDSIEAPSVISKSIDWVYTLHNITNVPRDVIELPGTVNDSLIVSNSLGLSFAAETLLMDNPSLVRKISPNGVPTWDITMRFAHKITGWNKFPNISAGTTDLNESYIYGAGSETPFRPYPLADFSVLIIA